MVSAALPPMTTREAKRAAKKRTAQFQYTASQMRRADRIDELENRRKALEDKDRNRKLSKRKREEQDAKARAVQRKLLNEGKITLEDTWGKVTASQPRLNSFFSRKITRPQSQHEPQLKESTNAENKANGLVPNENKVARHVFDSQGDTLVDKANVPSQATEPMCDEFTDDDLLLLFSSQPGQLTPAQVFPLRNSQQTKTTIPLGTLPCRHLSSVSSDKMPPKSDKTDFSQAFSHLQRRNASQHAGPATIRPVVDNSVTVSNPAAPIVQSTESDFDDNQTSDLTELANAVADSEDEAEMAADAATRQVRSGTPSPESLHRRRLTDDDENEESAESAEGEGEGENDDDNGDDNNNNIDDDNTFDDDDVDDATMAAMVSSFDRRQGGEPSFEDELSDNDLLEAARRAEEEAEKEGGE